MHLDELDFNKNYNFSGVFWFENEFDNRFSGTLEYTSEKGITLSLISVALNGTSYLLFKDSCAIQKMYGILQYNGESIKITLLDVFLSLSSHSFGGNSSSKIITGQARVLVSNIHLQDDKIKSLNIEYDDKFKSIFFYHTSPEDVSEVKAYGCDLIKLPNATISFDIFYTYTSLYNANQLDNFLCDSYKPKGKSTLKQFKELVTLFLQNHEHEIGIRQNTHSVITIKGRFSKVDTYLQIENKWRSFFELLVDKSITIKSSWISVESVYEEGKKSKSKKAILFQQYPLPVRSGSFGHKPHLPLNIDAFGEANNLAKLQKPYEKWNQLYEDKKWKRVIDGIKSIIYRKRLINDEDFVILVSYIETVLDLLGYKAQNLDELIKNFADSKWKTDVNILLKTLPTNKTMGQNISELRNSMVHPKSAEKEKGKYFAVVTNQILIQKIYAYLAGLFIKMVLLHLYNFNTKNLQKYLDCFIASRSGIYQLKYDKDYKIYKTRLEKKLKKKKSTPHSK
jgi:hypothetical protein